MKLLAFLALAGSLAACASTAAPRAAMGEAVRPRAAHHLATPDAAPARLHASLEADPLSLAAELQAPGRTERLASPTPQPPRSGSRPRWPRGHSVMQGFLGAYDLTTIERHGGMLDPVDGSDDSLAQLPAIGGGGQWKLAGDRVDLGLEAMMSFGWRANAVAIAAGGGGAVVAVDVSLFLIDLYGGPFASVFLGDRVRVYGACGPMMQWASYDQSAAGNLDDGSGSGFGTGLYARTGLEFVVRPGLMIGGGVRWMDTHVSLDNGLGSLDMEGLQWAFTVSTGI